MIETVYMDIKGMHCINCPIKIEKAFAKKDGVIEIEVNWGSEKGCVTFDSNLITIADIFDQIHKMGFEAKEVLRHTL
jgi:Cu+-exporting ATPase